MNQTLSILVLSFLVGFTAKAQQNITDAKKYSAPVVTAPAQDIKSSQLVAPEVAEQTPLEAQVAQVQAEEQAKKEAEEHKRYMDTDYRFFQVMNEPLGEDELDRTYKYEQDHYADRSLEVPEHPTPALKSPVTEKIASTEPAPVTAEKSADSREDRKRMISVQLAAHAEALKVCAKDPSKDLKDKKIVVAWEIEPSGNVTNQKIRYTDVDKDAQNCVMAAIKDWKFEEFMKNQPKNSRIEYTYRFANPDAKSMANQ